MHRLEDIKESSKRRKNCKIPQTTTRQSVATLKFRAEVHACDDAYAAHGRPDRNDVNDPHNIFHYFLDELKLSL